MQTLPVGTLTVYYDEEEADTARLVASACRQSLDLLQREWGLVVPGECRVYVMTGWLPFLFHSAPWPWRIYLGLTLPLRLRRIRALWAMAGGWAQRYGRRRVIGVKPARLMRQAQPAYEVFCERSEEDWVRHNTCHELTHAATDHLGLPLWLHEGLAMLAVDLLAGEPTVRPDTLGRYVAAQTPGSAAEPPGAPASLVHRAVRGYWTTRYLAETQPGLLHELLAQAPARTPIVARVAGALGLSREEPWHGIEARLLARYGAARGAEASTARVP